MAEQSKFYKGVFPSPLSDNAAKSDPKFGLSWAESIFSNFMSGNTSYFERRNRKFEENALFAAAKQPVKPYLDIMLFDNEDGYSKIDFTPNPIIMKYRRIAVDGFMNNKEKIKVTGLSDGIKDRKSRQKSDALFRMENKEWLAQVQEASKVPLEDADAFTPESKDEYDLWEDTLDRVREEILMEEGLEFILKNNEFTTKQKRRLICDYFDFALAGAKRYIDSNGRIRIKYIKPTNLVYGASMECDLQDSPFIGHVERIKIVDVRSLYPHIKEQDLYKLAKNASAKFGNTALDYTFVKAFEESNHRPYDDFYVDMLFFECKLTQYLPYIKGTDRNGKKIFDIREPKGELTNPNKKAYQKSYTTVYSGAWFIGSDIMAEWGKATNIYQEKNADKEEPKYSYVVYMQEHNGDMLPRSVVDLMKAPVKQMDLAWIKIQQEIALASPNGYNIDVAAGDQIDLGEGMGTVSQLELRRIRVHTGDTFYDSRTIEGDLGNRNPIEQNIYQMGDKINHFINAYNMALNMIRDFTGQNEYTDSSSVNARAGMTLVQSQQNASNNATAHIYLSWVSILEGICKQSGDSLWDVLKYSKNINEGYISILGRENIDFIRQRKELTDSSYDFSIEADMSQSEQQSLERNINIALSGGLIELEDALEVKEIKNYKKATRFLALRKKVREEQREKLKNEAAQQNQMLNAQVQQETQAQAAEIDAAKDEREMAKIQMKNQGALNEREMELIKSAMDALIANPNVQLPPLVQKLVTRYEKQLEAEEIIQEQAMAQQESLEQMSPEEQQMLIEQQEQLQ